MTDDECGLLLAVLDGLENISIANVKMTALIIQLAHAQDDPDFRVADLLETVALPAKPLTQIQDMYNEVRARILESDLRGEDLKLLVAAMKGSLPVH